MKMASENPRGGCLRRMVVTVLVLAVIGAITLLWTARTKGGADLVKGALETRLGADLRLRRTSIGWPFDLVIEDLASLDTTSANEPYFQADEVRISLWRFWHPRVFVRRAELYLVRGEGGVWKPGSFSRLGELPVQRVSRLSVLTSRLRRRQSLEAVDSSIRWIDRDGTVHASAVGITFRLCPVAIPRHRMYYYYLSAYNVISPTGDRVSDIVCEWLASEERDYLQLDRSGRPEEAAQRGFWEVAGLNAGMPAEGVVEGEETE